MQKQRRSFLKKAAVTSAVVAVSAVSVAASSSKKVSDSNGVVIGKSDKKEVLYKESIAWEEYYKRALWKEKLWVKIVD